MFLFLISAIEGLTEFMPISSTAHMLLFAKVFGHQLSLSYLVCVQLGAMFAIFFAYFSHLKKIAVQCLAFNFSFAWKIAIITLPATVFGFALYFFYNTSNVTFKVVAFFLILGGVLMYFLRNFEGKKTVDELSMTDALKIGLFQVLSFIPGVSRSFSLILGCFACGLSKKDSLMVSVLSGFPIILGATVLDFSRHDVEIAPLLPHVFTAFVFSFLGIYIMKWLTEMKKDFHFFAFYRIIIGLMVCLVM